MSRQQQTHIITLRFQLSSHVEELCSDDCKQIKLLVHSGTQTIYADKESKSKLEDELRNIKEQLRSTEDNIAYLSEWMKTYRYRWIKDYHHAENLELHMPYGTYVPDLDQIPEGAASPKLFLE
ncbi:hypothetical protein BDR06DRAFT_975566 [Suillus hirtellus]|nr:hypothetical protein BDR06DRAFT_975566 [Suillus hirtellus]